MIKKLKKSFPFVAFFVALFVIIFAIVYWADGTLKVMNLTEHEQQAVEAVTYYKTLLKDPKSLRIYGDIHILNMENGNGFVVSYLDAKNSWGGYGGKEPIEITCIHASEKIPKNTFIAKERDSEGYYNLADDLDKYAKYEDGTLPLTHYKVDGAKIAKAIEAEYIEWEE